MEYATEIDLENAIADDSDRALIKRILELLSDEKAEEIVASLRRRNIPHEYHLYEGEGHGWRKPETIESFYKACDSFLRQHVLFA